MLRCMEQSGDSQHSAYILACPILDVCQIGDKAALVFQEQLLQDSGSFFGKGDYFFPGMWKIWFETWSGCIPTP